MSTVSMPLAAEALRRAAEQTFEVGEPPRSFPLERKKVRGLSTNPSVARPPPSRRLRLAIEAEGVRGELASKLHLLSGLLQLLWDVSEKEERSRDCDGQ